MELTQAAILVSVFSFSLCCIFGFALFAQRRRFALFQKQHEKQFQMVSSSVLGIGNRLLELESRLSAVRKDQQVLSDTQQDFSYSKAKKLIEQNIQLEAVAASTGLSFSEVELIRLIHQQAGLPAGSPESPPNASSTGLPKDELVNEQ